MGFGRNSLEEARIDTAVAAEKLAVLVERGTYTIKEIKEIRALLLLVVRNQLDPLLGHLPPERHY